MPTGCYQKNKENNQKFALERNQNLSEEKKTKGVDTLVKNKETFLKRKKIKASV